MRVPRSALAPTALVLVIAVVRLTAGADERTWRANEQEIRDRGVSGAKDQEYVPPQDVAPRSGAPSNPNLFFEAVIDSLAITADAHSFLLKAAPTDFEHMTNTRLAITKVKQAQQLVTPFLKSNDAMTSDVASAFSVVYESLAQLLGQSLDIYENLMRLDARVLDGAQGNYAQELAELGIASSKLGAEIDGAWKRVAEISALSTSFLVDRNRLDAGGKFPYLRITSKERANLRARLERFFDRQMLQKMGSGEHAVQVAPAILWQFLGQPGWKSADAP